MTDWRSTVAPEHVLDAERALVGACLVSPERVADVQDLDAARLFDPRWRQAWAAIRRLHDSGSEVDTFSVHGELARAGYGDAVPLTTLSEACVYSGYAVEAHAKTIRDASMTREILTALAEVRERFEQGVAGAELLGFAQSTLSGVQDVTRDETCTVADLLRGRFEELSVIADAKARGEAMATGLLTGVKSLDAQTGGLQRGMITILAGRPAMGKSAMAMTIGRNVAAAGLGIHVFSLEDTRSAYADRIFSNGVGVSTQAIRTCEGITAAHLGGFAATADRLRSQRWLINDSSALDADEIVRSVRRHAPKNNTGLVILDYIQLCQQRRGEDERRMINRTMKTLLSAARKDNLVFLVLSQLNRGVESREDKRPRLSDLRESGALEEQSKTVLFLFRPGYYDTRHSPTVLELNIAKQSNGPVGTVLAKFIGERMEVR